MIVVTVWQNKVLIMERLIKATNSCLARVMHNIEAYVIEEKLNTSGECIIKVRHTRDLKRR